LIDGLSRQEVQQFIIENENTDPFALSLKHKMLFGLPVKAIADQIQARKKAKTKIPEWFATKGIIYPPLLSIEQCSSEITAKYKASLLEGNTLIDLTGGTGIDTYYLSKNFKQTIYVEQNPLLCELALYNFHKLKNDNILVISDKSENYINTYDKNVSAIFIDPARRNEQKGKVFIWSDCEPDITTLQNSLLDKAEEVLIKASPMLDITASLATLNQVKQVHVVAVKNECKEVLYKLSRKFTHGPIEIKTINFTNANKFQTFDFTREEEHETTADFGEPRKFLFEPNAAIMKAGAFNMIAKRFNLTKLHPHTQLYSSNDLVNSFPGRVFKIENVVPYNKKTLLKYVTQKKANIAVRNFPDDVNAIRKKTGIKPGGDQYIFGTTVHDNQKVMIIGRKL